MKIPLASLGLRTQDISAAIEVLNSHQLTMGEKVRNFEKLMADYLGVRNFVMVNSGSSANLVMIEALMRPSKSEPKLHSGDGVLVPAVAWPTTIWPLIQLGLRPIFVDVDPDTIAIDLEEASKVIKGETNVRAVFPIHPLGYSIDGVSLDTFANQNNLILIHDVCESLGSWQDENHAGTIGKASSYSFYFSHHLTTMEGGGVATNDDDFADDLRAIRSHGWSRDRNDAEYWSQLNNEKLLTQTVSKNQLKFQFITTGYNVRPMEIQAAIGIEQLKSLDSFIERRRGIARQVKAILRNTVFSVVDGGTLEEESSEKRHSWMLIPIRIEIDLNPTLRALLDELLDKYEIESRPVLTGNFLRQPVMQRMKGMPNPKKFTIAERISQNYFMVGCHQDLTDSQVEYLCQKLNYIAQKLESTEQGTSRVES